MLHVLLVSVAGYLVCKAKLSVFLRFAFIMAFLLSLNGYPDPVMSRQIVEAVWLILMTGLLVLIFFAF